MQEIAADNIPRGMEAAAVGDLDHLCVGIGMRVRRIGIGGINADVMAGKTLDQLALGCNRPFFDVGGQPVRICKNEIRRFVWPISLAQSAAQASPAITVARVEGE